MRMFGAHHLEVVRVRRRAVVRVPATTANLGAGFDCVGAAVDRCLTASVVLQPQPELALRLHREPPNYYDVKKQARFVAYCKVRFVGELTNISLYAQDSLSHKRLSFQLGIRYDRNHDQVLAASVVANPLLPDWLPAATFAGADPGIIFNNFSPRVGFTFDVNGNGKTLARGIRLSHRGAFLARIGVVGWCLRRLLSGSRWLPSARLDQRASGRVPGILPRGSAALRAQPSHLL